MDNPAIASWRSAAVVAYTALGRHDEALALAGEQLALARKADGPVTLALALRAYAHAVPEAGDAEGALSEAVGLLDAGPARYELALALADYGAHLRRTGRRAAAQDPLRRALDLAQRAGAAPLAAQARGELLAAGARPRRAAITGPDSLTSAERRVAALAAEGLSNRQIAEHLFVTQATVETHLRHVFHKLGITSRADLPPA
jgi:DNA-binding CsgD family transcriptional regulator